MVKLKHADVAAFRDAVRAVGLLYTHMSRVRWRTHFCVVRIPGFHPAGVEERANIVMTDIGSSVEPEQPQMPTQARSDAGSGTRPYAIIETGGKQYRVGVGDTLSVEQLPVEAGADVTLDRVLLLGGHGATRVGTPTIAGAAVTARVDDHYMGEKIVVFKYKAKKRYRRRLGHRQSLTRLTITGITGA